MTKSVLDIMTLQNKASLGSTTLYTDGQIFYYVDENIFEILDKTDLEIIFTGKPLKGFMFKNYSNFFFFPEECMELDLYRQNIEKLNSDNKIKKPHSGELLYEKRNYCKYLNLKKETEFLFK